jgi:hypothetical protein
LFHNDSVDPGWGDVNVTLIGNLSGHSYPYLYEDATTAGYELLVGSDQGAIYRYTGIDGNLHGSFTEADTFFLGHDVGERATVSGALLNADNRVELLLGNFRGGVELFTRSFVTGIAPPVEAPCACTAMPNPAVSIIRVRCNLPVSRIALYDLTGRLVGMSALPELDISQLPAGLYNLNIEHDGGQSTKRVVVFTP